ncbi:NADH-quinone oxidoreductase subunit M, partial [bacterium]|nr:NADH-quinone oxidoreductase subunit M [bacterium]
ILSWVTFLPLAGALLIFLLGRTKAAARSAALAVALIDFVLSLHLYRHFDAGDAGDQFAEKVAWLADGKISYSLGLDGVSLFLVLLTTFLGPLVILSTWNAIQERVREAMGFLLVLQTAMIGTFVARDMLLFYFFWEAMLIPMYFLIGIWGGERRIYAAVKFFIYTMVGSVFMLVAILYCYYQAGSMELDKFMLLDLGRTEQMWLFAAFALAFAIKVPLFPFHTWLPDAHVEAPTAGSVILAAILLKMGTYGLLRFAIPLFPEAALLLGPWLARLAVVGIIYGALVAMVQKDVKKLVAYSSVSHLGFVVLGLFSLTATGVAGGLYQMLAHGLSTGALFLLVGVIYERRHTREIDEFGGLAHVMPAYASVFMFVTLASIGLPGLCGFTGEFLVLFGSFSSALLPQAKLLVVLSATGVVLGAIYMLWMYQRVFLGRLARDANRHLSDLNLREWIVLIPIMVFIVLLGVAPAPLLERMEPSIMRLLEPVTQALAGVAPAGGAVVDPGSVVTVGTGGER